MNDKENCLKQGMLATSAICNSFKPDINALFENIENLEPTLAFARVLSQVADSHLDLMAAVVQNEKRTRKAGLKFGQRVYVRYRGLASANYLSNFMSAFILDARKDYVRVMSRDGSITMSFDCQTGVKGPAVYSKHEFEPLRQQMKAKGNIVDPDMDSFAHKRVRSIELYELGLVDQSLQGEIPTIDTVFKENKVKVSKVNDLVALAKDIEKGFSAGKTATKYKVKRSSSKQKDEVIVIG